MTTHELPEDRRLAVTAPDAPAAIGPYSHAVVAHGLLYCSGSLPLDADTGELVDESLAAETTQCLENLEAICRAAGTILKDAVRLTIYTTRLDAFGEINEAYGKCFTAAPPARVTIGVAALPKGARVEIDAIVAMS
jgi:2-iminobutanoate/2-iminopropanoate deaminase